LWLVLLGDPDYQQCRGPHLSNGRESARRPQT
jgi:hypothetical protein